MSGTKGMQHYEREIKEKAVRMYLDEQRSYAGIAQELGIRKTSKNRSVGRDVSKRRRSFV